nr:amidohydrolase family protein [Arthrobacter pigmenti]
MYLTPGFIDAHVHLTMPAGQLGGARMLDLPPRYGYYSAIPILKATLDAGITTARDLGGIDMATDVAIREGIIEGPELIYAYRALGPTGGHGDFRTCCGFNLGQAVSPNGDIGFLTDGVDQAIRNTREVMRLGAKVIKVMASGGVWSPRDQPWHDGLNVDEMRAVVEEAASHDVPVAAHAQSARSIANALKAGVRSIEHAYEIDDAAIGLMLERGAFMVPTLSTGTTPPDPAKAAPYAVEKKLRLQEKLQTCVANAVAAGVRVAMGTDAGVCPHGTNLTELGHLVDLGMKPIDAINAGTLNAAELLQIDNRTGSIELGKEADLVLTPVDPLAGIHQLGNPDNIAVVVAKGRLKKNLLAAIPALEPVS